MIRRSLLISALFCGPSYAVDLSDADAPPQTGAEVVVGGRRLVDEFSKFFENQTNDSFIKENDVSKLARLISEYKSKPSKTTLTEIHSLSRKRFVDALRFIGYIYSKGDNVVLQDYDVAARYFWEAAKLKDYKSMYNLGVLSRYGIGIPKNVDYAAKMFSASLRLNTSKMQMAFIEEERGNLRAALDLYGGLGLDAGSHPISYYKRGRDIFLKDGPYSSKMRGIELLTEAANRWESNAQRLLVDIYHKGLFVPENHRSAAIHLMALKENKYPAPGVLSNLPSIVLDEKILAEVAGVHRVWMTFHSNQQPPYDYRKLMD